MAGCVALYILAICCRYSCVMFYSIAVCCCCMYVLPSIQTSCILLHVFIRIMGAFLQMVPTNKVFSHLLLYLAGMPLDNYIYRVKKTMIESMRLFRLCLL